MTVSTNTFYTITDASGRTLRTGTAPEDQIDAQADTSLGEVAHYTKTVIETEKIVVTPVTTEGGTVNVSTSVPKEPHGIVYNKLTLMANGTDAVTFSSIPTGTYLTITMPIGMLIDDIVGLAITDGVAQITTTVIGAYILSFNDNLTQPYTVTINAN